MFPLFALYVGSHVGSHVGSYVWIIIKHFGTKIGPKLSHFGYAFKEMKYNFFLSGRKILKEDGSLPTGGGGGGGRGGWKLSEPASPSPSEVLWLHPCPPPPHTAPVHQRRERHRRISVCVAAVTVLPEMKQCERSKTPIHLSANHLSSRSLQLLKGGWVDWIWSSVYKSASKICIYSTVDRVD